MKRIALLSALALLLSGCSQGAAPYQKTATFLHTQFVEGKYLDGFTKGKPDLGFTLEAIVQLSHANVNLDAAKVWAFDQTPTSNGLAGKFLFAAHTVGLSNSETTKALAALSSAWITSSPTTPDTDVFSIAWQVLGLASCKHSSEAKNAASVLANLRLADGGWGGTDATSIALMAFEATADEANANLAVSWLEKHEVKDHFEAYGDVDVNGTEYAIMALHSAGEDVSKLQGWLRKQVAVDGGIQTSWSKGRGDTFATAQGYLALIGQDYVALTK